MPRKGKPPEFDSPNKKLFEEIAERLHKEFIKYESNDDGKRIDSVIMIGVAFNPNDKNVVAVTEAILGESCSMCVGMITAAKNSPDFGKRVLCAIHKEVIERDPIQRLMELLLRHRTDDEPQTFNDAEIIPNNDEGVGG